MTQFTLETPFRLIFGTRFIIITLVAIVLMLSPASTAKAQWATSGTNIYNTNSGNVGVGTSTPAAKLEVSGDNALPRITNTNASSYGGLELFEGGTLKFGLHTMGSASGSAYVGGANALQLWNYANSPMVFGTNSSERMRIDANGNVGIGVTNPGVHAKFEVNGAGAPDYAIFSDWLNSTLRIGRSGTTLQLRTDDSQNLALMPGGNVGIGTTTPNTNLVGTFSYPASLKLVQIDSTQSRLIVRGSADSGIDLISTNAGLKWMQLYNNAGITKFRSVDDSANLKADNVVAMDNSTGNVGIGTAPTAYRLDINGNTNITGSFNASGTITGGTIVAKYQDVAEWVPASHTLPAGTVVTLDPTKSNHVEASTHAYDTRVAGVVSEQPGITLGENGDNKVLVATTGRVLVTVDASHSPIHIGDLLVTSDITGVAMKSEPITIGGRQIHSPGTLIGKALEPLGKGSGKILVLLSLQ